MGPYTLGSNLHNRRHNSHHNSHQSLASGSWRRSKEATKEVGGGVHTRAANPYHVCTDYCVTCWVLQEFHGWLETWRTREPIQAISFFSTAAQ